MIRASVNQGRWIAECPFCPGALLVDDQFRWFYCLNCYNAEVAHNMFPIRMPRNRREIETILLRRPHSDFMSWTPGMTIEELTLAGPFHRSWTTPRTWVAAEIVTAALMNTHVRDNLLETSPAVATVAGDTVHADGANSLARLAVGSAGAIYVVDNGVPSWKLVANAEVTASETSASTTFTNLATSGPSVTVTIGTSGLALVMTCRFFTDTVGHSGLASIDISGATTDAASDAEGLRYESGNVNDVAQFGRTRLYTGLNAGSTTFKMVYRASGGMSTFANRHLIVLPL